MKKTLSILTLFFAAAVCAFAADNGKVATKKISALVSEYSIHDGFETVRIGNLGTTLLKGLIGTSGISYEDLGEAMKFFNGIKKIAIVEYGDAETGLRDSFNVKVERALKDCEVLMEAKDEETMMRIYGSYDGNSNKVHDFVLFCPEDCALILLSGYISMDALGLM